MKALILYYSRSGNTEKLAKQIQQDLSCDLLKIVPEEAYGNYVASCLRVMKERKQNVASAFVTKIPDLTAYDVIFLGYPIWAQDVPMFVSEFVRQCNIKGKTIIPFATYGMSGINWTRKTLDNICQGATIAFPYDSGLLKKGDYAAWMQSVKQWMESHHQKSETC